MPDTTTLAGAMPAADGATPSQTTPVSPASATPPAAATPPATDDTQALGEPGKRALDSMKAERDAATKAAKALEKELSDLKAASLSDTEKAIVKARTDGATEAATKLTGRIRRSEVRAALIAAGASGTLLDLAVRADDFEALTVSDEGEVDGLDAAVAAFAKAHPDLFSKAPINGTAEGGTRGKPVGLTRERIQAMSPAEYQANRAQIFEWMEQRAK